LQEENSELVGRGDVLRRFGWLGQASGEKIVLFMEFILPAGIYKAMEMPTIGNT